MLASSSAELSEVMVNIFKHGSVSLFAGAGVSGRAGIPTWTSYLDGLASTAEKYEDLTAQMMRARLKSNLLLEAAHLFKICPAMPVGEKLRALAAPFTKGHYDPTKLASLAALPFEMVATTNYDNSLHDAFAISHQCSIKTAELDDATMKQAPFWKDFHIVRLHGRAEVPDSIVIDEMDYRGLLTNNDYKDLLRNILSSRSLVFIGFSFIDPAINEILEFYASLGVYPRLHYAFVPQGNQGLSERLARYNINVTEYDPKDDHACLWGALNLCSKPVMQETIPAREDRSTNFDTAKRLLSACYARACMGKDASALTSIIIEGIVLSEMVAGSGSIDDLTSRLRGYMALSEGEAQILVNTAIANLSDKGICMQDQDVVVLINYAEPQDSPLEVLVTGIESRALLREKFEIPSRIHQGIASAVEEVIVLRGFDLGAEFSGATGRDEIDTAKTIRAAIDKNLPGDWASRREMLAEVFAEMLRRPDQKEEAVLGEYGRISFGIELILQAGRTTMYALSLPETIYLDTNVLLPAIVRGHPRATAYRSAISAIQQASTQAGKSSSLFIADVFIDEILSQRSRAVEMVREEKLEDVDVLRRRVLYYGADNINVYISGYSSWIKNAPEAFSSFADYLRIEAPYSNTEQLVKFLANQGIKIAVSSSHKGKWADDQQAVIGQLEKGYAIAEEREGQRASKAQVLKKHEGVQLHLMQTDDQKGRRAMLVTADSKLRRALNYSSLANLRDSLITPKNLVQLVDLLIGIDVPPASLSRLLWSVKIADGHEAIKNYLLTRALESYDAGLLLRMNDLLDAHADQISKKAELEGIDLATMKVDERSKTSRFMDRVETEVFANMAEEVHKLKKHLKQTEQDS